MISHKHKCIFIHIPKTAGTSINSFFFPKVAFHYNNPDYERLFGWCPKRKLHMQHATTKQLLETELITPEQWEHYYKFTFVRNPWDRTYSDYNWIQKFSQINGNFNEYINKKGAFNTILNDDSNSSYLGDHLTPQTDFYYETGEFTPDFIGRFENLSNDMNVILDALEIKDPFNIFLNRSERKKDYSLFYTATRKRLVDTKFKKDIELLDYSFEDNRKGIHYFKRLL